MPEDKVGSIYRVSVYLFIIFLVCNQIRHAPFSWTLGTSRAKLPVGNKVATAPINNRIPKCTEVDEFTAFPGVWNELLLAL